jgi:hypothetical protein
MLKLDYAAQYENSTSFDADDRANRAGQPPSRTKIR